MTNDKERLTHYHNKGQEDASKDRYDPPIDGLRGALTMYDDRDVENQKKYNEGWRNTKNQEDSNSGSCCYITTACLRALNLPEEDSLEFKAMKVLTKDHILKSRQGKRDYISYNRKSPRIVAEINSRKDAQEVWSGVYEKLRTVTQLVFDGKHEEGYHAYKSLVFVLENQFVIRN